MVAYQNTILITGGTVGLGYYTALTIAKAQPTTEVVIASRTDKANAADTINTKLGQSNTVFKRLDLADQSNIRSFVAEWKQQGHASIAALVLNAGLQFPASKPVYTKDGIEMTFGVNHVGHALLFHLLCSQLSSDCRVLVVSSGTHDPAQKAPVPVPNYTSVEALAFPTDDALKVNGVERYSTSKLCNVLWTYALNRHIGQVRQSNSSIKWAANAMDPGLMLETSLHRAYPVYISWIALLLARMSWLMRLLIGPNVHTAAESGEALARLAIANDVQGLSGRYFEGLKEIKSSETSYQEEKQDELWAGTIRLVAKDEAERKSFAALS